MANRNKCACESFSYRTYNAVSATGKLLYGGHYRCGAFKAIRDTESQAGKIVIWEGAKIVEEIFIQQGQAVGGLVPSAYVPKLVGDCR